MEIIDNLKNLKEKYTQVEWIFFMLMEILTPVFALRTAIAKNNKLYVQAGAGIVADSKPINEFKNSKKAQALINALT